MRRLAAAVLLIALVTYGSAGCRRRKRAMPREDGGLMSVVNVADPVASAQLLRGFYNVEADAWRWTSGKFAVVLRTPVGASQNGAKLELKFTLHDAIFKQTGPITVSATVNGAAVAPETFSQVGEFTYSHEVPASALSSEVATVEFTVDKPLPPSAQDQRELALIVTSIGLEAK